MALLDFLLGPGRDEETALAFLRERGIFETEENVRCIKNPDGANWGSIT